MIPSPGPGPYYYLRLRSPSACRLIMLLTVALTTAFVLQPAPGAPACVHLCARRAVTRALSDDDLFAELRARQSGAKDASQSGAPPPLGPDDVGADSMGPAEVVEYCLASLQASSEAGAKALMSFAVKYDDGSGAEDKLGQLQPGHFGDVVAFATFLAGHERYETLTQLEEYKCMGPPELKNSARGAAQKLLVRRDGRNWEDLFVNMQLADMGPDAVTPRRWLITSIYKQGACV